MTDTGSPTPIDGLGIPRWAVPGEELGTKTCVCSPLRVAEAPAGLSPHRGSQAVMGAVGSVYSCGG